MALAWPGTSLPNCLTPCNTLYPLTEPSQAWQVRYGPPGGGSLPSGGMRCTRLAAGKGSAVGGVGARGARGWRLVGTDWYPSKGGVLAHESMQGFGSVQVGIVDSKSTQGWHSQCVSCAFRRTRASPPERRKPLTPQL